jgi:hypothetical protein
MTFTYKLEQADGTPADPPTVRTAVPDIRPATRSRSGQAGRCGSSQPSPRATTSRPSWSSRTWPKERLATPPDVA